jgi:hypothetical protein
MGVGSRAIDRHLMKEENAKNVKPYDLTGNIIAFESGELDADATIELFQYLVSTGMAWQLQGSYGREAMRMIDAGLIHR